jgi:hypothetical protein
MEMSLSECTRGEETAWGEETDWSVAEKGGGKKKGGGRQRTERKRREEAKERREEEAHAKRMKDVEQEKKNRSKNERQREEEKAGDATFGRWRLLRFLQREAGWEKMLVEEAKERLLATSSKKINEAEKAAAQAEWARLEREDANREEQPPTPVYRYRSLMAERNRKLLEAIGSRADSEKDKC